MINNNKSTFDYATPTYSQIEVITKVREGFKTLEPIIRSLPASRENSLSISKLEEAAMWAIKGILLNLE